MSHYGGRMLPPLDGDHRTGINTPSPLVPSRGVSRSTFYDVENDHEEEVDRDLYFLLKHEHELTRTVEGLRQKIDSLYNSGRVAHSPRGASSCISSRSASPRVSRAPSPAVDTGVPVPPLLSERSHRNSGSSRPHSQSVLRAASPRSHPAPIAPSPPLVNTDRLRTIPLSQNSFKTSPLSLQRRHKISQKPYSPFTKEIDKMRFWIYPQYN